MFMVLWLTMQPRADYETEEQWEVAVHGFQFREKSLVREKNNQVKDYLLLDFLTWSSLFSKEEDK